ncbi:MAG: 30S ribosomal protein S1 [Lysobacteraceae bacterium]
MTPAATESFAELFEQSQAHIAKLKPGAIVTGTVVDVRSDVVVINAGLKSEGIVPIEQFRNDAGEIDVGIGDTVKVALDSLENGFGETVLSREKAKRAMVWDELEEALEKNETITGRISGKVKGGFTVDIKDVRAFLPGSLVDVRPVRDPVYLEGKELEFKLIKLDRKRNNVVVSRRAVVESEHSEEREKLLERLQEGAVVKGVVKNLTDYGAFVDLGGIDGLLHVTDMAWRRVNHPSEILSIGQQVKVQIIRINQETHRISLGMKQLESDPWDGISAKYPVGKKISGTVTNITDYGAFVELEPGIEGLIHISEMSWTKKNVHPGKILSTSQEVEVVVLEVDPTKRRISLGLKQTLENPWAAFARNHPAGTEVEGEVKNKTEFGLFIGLDGDVDGMVHLSDLDWNRPGEQVIEEYNKGDVVKAVVLDVDVDKERISLGIKQLGKDAVGDAATSGDLRKNSVVSCEVTAVNDGGIEVKLVNHEELTSFIRRADLSRDRDEQRPERFQVGQIVDARVINFSKKDRKVGLSIKALEIAEEKEAVAQFGSSDSGASLGDILGAALKNREQN